MLKLSVIIPVYNVAPYVRKCVESVLAQDLDPKEYEVILVDDGSTDGSGEICDSLAEGRIGGEAERQIGNIKVLHQKNQGLSAARNAGIAVAKGKYIQFVDSDDYLEPNVLAGLVEQMERENLDVLRFDYQNVRLISDGQYEIFQPYKHPHQVDTQSNVTDGETYLNTRMGYACYAVQFMIKRESLTPAPSPEGEGSDTGCLFTPGIHFEDVEWTPRMVLRAKRMNATTTIVYNYLMREGSITKAVNTIKLRKNLDDKFIVIDTLNALIENHPQCQWLRNMRSRMAEGAITMVATHFYDERRQYIDQLRARQVFPLSIRNQSKTYKRRAMLINVSPRLYCTISHLLYSK